MQSHASYPRLAGPTLALLVAACSSSSEPPPVAAGDVHIECAVNGSAKLGNVCSVERVERGGKATLVVHHPDGGFRRFDMATDGTGLNAADGAQVAVARLDGDRLDVTVGADRYIFPARTTPSENRSDAPG